MANENDNKWEDIDYSDEAEEEQESFDYDDEISDDDEASEEYESGEFQDEEIRPAAPKKNQAIILLILIIVLGLLGLLIIAKLLSSKGENVAQNPTAPAVEVAETNNTSADLNNAFFDESTENNENSDVMGVDFNDNGAANIVGDGIPEGQVATIADAPMQAVKSDDLFESTAATSSAANPAAKSPLTSGFDTSAAAPAKSDSIEVAQEQNAVLESFSNTSKAGTPDNSIMVALNRAARQNPFKPPVIKQTQEDKYETYGNVQFEIIEPPTQLVPDQNLTKLLQTQISGILYDDDSPSAIVNLAGVDQFVKIGDVISGYKIKNITRTKVEISYKNNTYVASVGELFTPGELEEKPAVANLNKKFAGRYQEEK